MDRFSIVLIVLVVIVFGPVLKRVFWDVWR
jgi:hypothetical protein